MCFIPTLFLNAVAVILNKILVFNVVQASTQRLNLHGNDVSQARWVLLFRAYCACAVHMYMRLEIFCGHA